MQDSTGKYEKWSKIYRSEAKLQVSLEIVENK